jgi:hypothetical protein
MEAWLAIDFNRMPRPFHLTYQLSLLAIVQYFYLTVKQHQPTISQTVVCVMISQSTQQLDLRSFVTHGCLQCTHGGLHNGRDPI